MINFNFKNLPYNVELNSLFHNVCYNNLFNMKIIKYILLFLVSKLFENSQAIIVNDS